MQNKICECTNSDIDQAMTEQELIASADEEMQYFEAESVGTTLLTILETSPEIDKYGNWLIAGTCAAAILLISQIDSVVPYITTSGFTMLFMLLAASVLSGMIAKYFGAKCQIQSRYFVNVVSAMRDAQSNYNARIKYWTTIAERIGSDFVPAMNNDRCNEMLLNSFPRWKRKWLRNRMKDRIATGKPPLADAIDYIHLQGAFTFLQLVFILIAFVLVGMKVTH